MMGTIRRNQNSVKTYLALIAIIAVFCLAYPSTAKAAVGVDAVSSNSTTGISITISHTTSGSNRLMLVGVSLNNDGYEIVTGVTYNSVALTPVGTIANDDDARVEIWRLIAPDTGTHDVVVTFSADLAQEGFAGVVTFTGVHQTTPLGTFASAIGDGITATVDVSSATGELVFDAVASEYATSATVGAGQTEQWNIILSNSIGAGSTEPGVATVTMSWTLTGSQDHWAIAGVPVKPAPSGSLTLANHAYGQVSDKFTATSPLTDLLYRFKLTRSGTVTVDNMRVNFTTSGGVANGDVSSGELWEDADNDGVVDDPGDTQIQGSVTPASGVLTFTNNFSPSIGGTNYLVRATVSNLTGGDATTFSVGTAEIDEVEGVVTESGSISNATHTQDSTTFTTNYRSIGTNTGTLYNTGNASISSGTTTVTFGGGASLPEPTDVGAVGVGDKLVIGSETFYILSRDNATQVTVQSAATSTHSNASYTITRAYNDIQTWENDRDGNLVSNEYVEVGVCYKDGTFLMTGETRFDGSITDSTHYIHLTVAEGQRHNGTAGTGVVVDGQGGVGTHLFNIRDPYTRLEWLEITNIYDNLGQPIITDNPPDADGSLIAHILLHDYSSDIRGINIYGSVTVRNCIVYDGDVGIRMYEDFITVTMDNNTVYNMSGDGFSIRQTATAIMRNNISVGCGGQDFDIESGITVDPSSGNNLYSTVDNSIHPGTNNQSPPASLDDLFISIISGLEDLHIELCGHDALGNGQNLSGSFTDDIDGETRSGTWDIGADEVVCDYSYRKPITIQSSQVSGSSDFTDFPVLISLSGTWLRTSTADPANGHIENANGYDIIFKDTGGTQLDHEVEDYDGSASGGTLVAWVRIPTLSYNTDTVIYVYYGKSCICSSQENITGVWDSDYVAVWHFKESSGTVYDSTSNDNDASPQGTPSYVDAKISKAYNTTNGYFSVPYSSSLDFVSGSMFIECWAKYDDFTGGQDPGIFVWNDGNNDMFGFNDPTTPRFRLSSTSLESGTASTDTWYYFVGRYNGSNMYTYHNTSQLGSISKTGNTAFADGTNTIGYRSAYTSYIDGIIDELRISKIDRGVDYMTTTYNNQNSPATFNSEGSEEEAGDAYLAEHAAGQEVDKFGAQSSITGAELFAFKLTNETGSQVTVSEVQFQLSSVRGVVQGDFSNLAIYVDSNNDGAIGGGETTTVGGTGTVDAGVTAITFSSAFNISASTTVNYILKGDVSNLLRNDTVTMDLGTSNVTLTPGTVGGTAPTSVTHTSDVVCDYSSWRQITIDNTKVSGSSNLTNFPALINLSGTWLRTTTADPTNGRIQNANGYDIIFKDTGGTQLDHEIESYDGSASGGTLVVWVRIPTLSYNIDTVIYMYYGNGCISTSQENITGVWNSNYKGVWHLKETPTVDSYAYDSTTNDNDGTFQNMASDDQVAGQMNGSLEFSGERENISQATATADITTTSGSDTAVDSMSITPGAGDYLVWFSGSVENNSGNRTVYVSVYDNGVQVAHTEREAYIESSITNTSYPIAIHAYISGVGAGEAIDVRWRTTGGTATMHERTLTIKGVDSADASQAIATLDDDITSATDVAVDNMSLTPGAGDYLVWFSSSMQNSTPVATYQYVSLYVNNIQVAHTEREIYTEESIANTSFPIMFQALVTGVGAGQAIEARARTTGGTLTLHERTLVVEKIDSSEASQATATLDTNTTSSTYTAVDSMSRTPGAGDYLVWFSGTVSNSSDGLTEHISLFVNGTQVAHTEREIYVEGSLDMGNSFPVGLHARVIGVGAGEAIDVRWKRTGGTATMHERTLVVKKDTTNTGFGDYVDLDSHIGDYASLAVGSISIWFKYTDTSDYKILFSASCNTDNNSDLDIMYYNPDNVFMTGIREDGTNVWNCSFPTNYADGSWHHYVMTVDGSGNKHYIDGSQITGNYTYGGSASTQAFFNSVTGLNTLRFGNREDLNGNQYHFGGNLDEVRISNIALSADWVQTEHNNQNDPSTFYGVGIEECEYSYQRTITILSSQVSGTADHTDFPALVSLSGDWLKTTTADPTNGRIENSSGYDIIFKDTSGTQLDHEIEGYDGSASGGILVAWVRIPTLFYNTDTVIYMYYGNDCISSSQENVTGVWDSGYVGVWHLSQTPDTDGGTDEILDSNNNNDGDSQNMASNDQVPGRIDGSLDFDGSDDYVDLSTTMNPQTYDDFTISAWYKSTDASVSDDEYIYNHRTDSLNEIMFGPTDDASHTDQLRLFIERVESGAGDNYYYSTTDVVDQTWHYLTAVRTPAERIKIYVDGTEELDDPGDTSGTFTWDGIGPYIGDWPGATEQVHGLLDEVRVSNIARTADWIQTEYNNQDDPSNFYNVGNEEDVGDVLLADHAAGQEANKFGAGSSVSGAELFAFKLTNNEGSTVTVSQVVFQLSSVSGIVQGDFSNLEIYVDSDNDGTIEAGETTTVGGSGTVNAGVSTITFSTDFNISASTTVNYILKGDVSNLVQNDTVTIDLGTSNVTLTAGTLGGIAPASATHTSSAVCEYSSWRQITIDNTKVSGTSDHTNFPLLVSLSGDWLKTTTADPTNGRIQNASGYDIIFKDTGGTQLDHEIEEYDGTNGTLIAWVRIPTLSYNTDTVIYIYYGNACISSSQENVTGVWNSNYVGVWHLKETPTVDSNAYDSTSNDNDGTFEASMTSGDQVTGKVAGSLDFDGSDDEVLFSNAIIGSSAKWTITVWMKTASAAKQTIYSEGDLSTGNYLYIDKNPSSHVEFYLENNPEGWPLFSGTKNVEDDEFHHVAIVQRSQTDRELFVDGQSDGTNIQDSGTPTHDTASIGLLRTQGWAADPFNGIIDEVRISDTDRSAGWTQTEYNNQNDPSTFYSVGSEGAGCSYSHKKPITIQSSQVSGSSDLSNFPVLVSLTDANLRHIDSGGHVTNTNGYDIIFKASDQTTQLDHELESYDSSAGTIVAWVRIPTLSYNTDTVIYMYYGNICISASQENVTGVWNSSYKGVWHLKETPTVDSYAYDSTTNNNDGTFEASMTSGDQIAGQIDGSLDFDAVDDYIQTPSNELKTENNFTVSAWFKTNSLTYAHHILWQGQSTGNGWGAEDEMHIAIGEYTASGLANRLSFFLGNNGPDATPDVLSFGIDFTDNTNWNFVAVTVSNLNASPSAEMFLNGGSVATDTGTTAATTRTTWDTALRFGRPGSASRLCDGLVDEVRIYNTVLTADWIATEYSNQNTPSSFYNEGSEESAGTVTLSNHAAGQEIDKFDTGPAVTGAELFAFKLTNTTSSIVTVKKLLFPLSAVTGISQGDFANLELYVDANNDGTIGGGETTTVGGAGEVNAGVTDITFSDDFSISATTAVNYILVGDVSNLFENDTVTIGLNPADVTITAGHVGGSAPSSATHTSDAQCTFAYRRPITIQFSQVSGTADFSNFPVLISLSGIWLRTTTADPTNGHIENANGYDIIFRDSTGTYQLDHEIEDYDGSGSGGTLVAWVRIPTLKGNENTVIYMYYGNGCITSSTENVTGVWDSNYKAVWHLKEDPSGTPPQINDSTLNNNDGTTGGTMISGNQVAGQINGSVDFDGTDDYATMPTTGFNTSAGTVGAWINADSFPAASGVEYIYAHRQDSPTTDRVYIQLWDNNTWGTGMGDTYDLVRGSTLGIDTWYHLVITWDGTNVRGYLNGSLDFGPTSYTGLTTVREICVMAWSSAQEWADGTLDELRLSSTDRSADWIKTEYNNQNDPATFYNIGNEEFPASTAVDLISFTATGQDENVLVEWETAQEIDNLGFNLYRSTELGGSYSKLNSRLIPGLLSSVVGQQYTYVDRDVTRSVLYFYMLEDVDLDGTRTMHGPISVDWDGDGTPDDYIEDPDDDTDTDTEEEDPEVSIPDTEFDELESDHTDWTPSNIGGSASWVKIASFKAYEQDDGVALEWVTSFEVDNLGFHVYREIDGKFYRVTPDLVPGSVFSVGEGSELPAGQSYAYWDALSKQTGREFYWLDSIELNGGRASFGPIEPEISGKPIHKGRQARFKSITDYQVSRAQARGKIKALREELSVAPIRERKSKAIFYEVVPDNKPSEPRLPPSEEQWALSAQPGVKIYVKEDGWYRVGEPDLVAAGLRPGIDPRYLQLYRDGVEQSILVTGDEDGRFDPTDAVEFYGIALDTPFSDAHVYWLVVGSRPGRRLDTPFTDIRIGPDKGMRVPRGLRGRGGTLSFPYTVELKERTFYFAALKSGERDNFFGSVISTDPVDQLLTLPNRAPSSPRGTMLEVGLQGATDVYHQVRILFNYRDAYDVGFSGQLRGRVEIQISQGSLLEGDNIVTLIAQGGSMDISLVDYVRITYWRTYTADDDLLRFKATGGEWLSIGGFSTPGIRVVDITDSMRMLNVRGKVKSGGSDYAITIKIPGGGERTLLAFTDENIKQPAAIAANLASSWHELSQGADVVIIGHSDLLESVRPLKKLREQQGLSVVLVDVEDLYDEFNFGAKSPWALKDFLAQAFQYWNPQPRYLILVGDTSYDPRNYLGYGEFDLLPTKFVDTEKLKTASDDWFVDFDGDELPEMAVGRLPAASAEEAKAVVTKIINYEGYADLMNEVLLVADINDFFNFEQASAKVAELLPGNLSVNEIFRGRSATARSDLLDLLNQGQLLVNYFGHGSTQIWNGNLLTYSDAFGLTNSPNLPFFINTTCLNGFFQDPYSESLAEALLKEEHGGAVAVWTSSGLTDPEEQVPLNEELIQLLFNGEGLTIGEAVMRAKQAVTDSDIRRTWILFGDPTLRLR